jgi:chromosome partitioning protein
VSSRGAAGSLPDEHGDELRSRPTGPVDTPGPADPDAAPDHSEQKSAPFADTSATRSLADRSAGGGGTLREEVHDRADDSGGSATRGERRATVEVRDPDVSEPAVAVEGGASEEAEAHHAADAGSSVVDGDQGGPSEPADAEQGLPRRELAVDTVEEPSPGKPGATGIGSDVGAAAESATPPTVDPSPDADQTEPASGREFPAVSRETPVVKAMAAPAETRIIVVANQKGGVGKTTTSVNLAAALALGGLSVLVVDLDPQGNASTALGVDHPSGTKGTYEVLIDGEPIADYTVESPEAPRLQVLPATVDLAGAEIELVSVVARENRLKRALKKYVAEHSVDYILIDCPPSLGLLTINALVAAREVMIPIQCEYYALEGVSQLMNTIDLVMAELNDELVLSTVLLTMYDARTRLAAQVADEVRAYFAEQTLPTVIPRSVRISEAPSYGQTVLTYHPESAGAVSYLEAAHEIARRGAKENS